jgi:hypothetical protein
MRAGSQPVVVGLARKPVTRHRRNHHIESVRCLAAMRRRVDERVDDLQLLDNRARPSVRDDDRQGILMLRANVNEMNVQPVDLGDEVRQGVQPRFDLAPFVFRRPIASEFLDGRERHALRCIRFPVRPPGRVDALAQIGKFRFWKIHPKRMNRGLVRGPRATLFCSAGQHDWNGFGILGLECRSAHDNLP